MLSSEFQVISVLRIVVSIACYRNGNMNVHDFDRSGCSLTRDRNIILRKQARQTFDPFLMLHKIRFPWNATLYLREKFL